MRGSRWPLILTKIKRGEERQRAAIMRRPQSQRTWSLLEVLDRLLPLCPDTSTGLSMGPSQRDQALLWNPSLPGSAGPKGSCEWGRTLPAITAPSKRLWPRQHARGGQDLSPASMSQDRWVTGRSQSVLLIMELNNSQRQGKSTCKWDGTSLYSLAITLLGNSGSQVSSLASSVFGLVLCSGFGADVSRHKDGSFVGQCCLYSDRQADNTLPLLPEMQAVSPVRDSKRCQRGRTAFLPRPSSAKPL